MSTLLIFPNLFKLEYQIVGVFAAIFLGSGKKVENLEFPISEIWLNTHGWEDSEVSPELAKGC
ncbi:hypothetical protein IJ00_13955 [Calothrix sp. 336/3]|nr:hypothetical protein IJ00_13955 [Calothrix sp. 336/3]